LTLEYPNVSDNNNALAQGQRNDTSEFRSQPKSSVLFEYMTRQSTQIRSNPYMCSDDTVNHNSSQKPNTANKIMQHNKYKYDLPKSVMIYKKLVHPTNVYDWVLTRLFL